MQTPNLYGNGQRSRPRIRYDRITPEDLLRSQFLRLNTLYKVVNKDGDLVPFRMNDEQYDFYRRMHNLNVILKARQRGFTTLIQLYMLDTALFNPNTSCGVIAHTKEDATKFFDKKIKLAYDNLPVDFAAECLPSAEQDNKNQLKFSNGSYITVGTSLRGDTLQYLHVSEFGKLCAKSPERADEVVSGALNTVSAGNWITIESTGEGAHGHFYDITQRAMDLHEIGAELTPMDYKFFFYPWYAAEEYELGGHVDFDRDDTRYFATLETDNDLYLSRPKKNWYVKKRREQGERMLREYPSIPEESFRGILDGAPFSRIMSNLRRTGHITHVPWARNYPVHTFWDLGRNDHTAIWFMQQIGAQIRFIDYYQDRFKPLDHYARVLLNDKPYVYGTHYLPHDAGNTDLTEVEGRTREEVLNDLGLDDTIITPRISSEQEAIDMTRSAMGSVYFDTKKCEQGIISLENARFKYNEQLQGYLPNLQRTPHKHGTDAFMQYGQGYRHAVETISAERSGSVISRPARSQARTRKSVSGAVSRDWRT